MSTTDPANTRAVFKAYDVRGVVPDQLDEELARRTGAAFVRGRRCRDRRGRPRHAARARRPWPRRSPRAPPDAGADVVMIGLASTDQLYFASGHLGHPGAMFTASHNPAQYNGIKMCRAGAQPIGADTGLHEIRDAVSGPEPQPAARPGEHLPARRARRVRRSPAVARTGRGSPAQGRRRRRQRHGRAHRAGRLRPASATTSSWSRCTSSSTAPSRTTRPTRSSRRTSSTCRSASSRRTPTWAWPSTATPTAASSSTSSAARCRRRP